jgi:ribosomal protein L37E
VSTGEKQFRPFGALGAVLILVFVSLSLTGPFASWAQGWPSAAVPAGVLLMLAEDQFLKRQAQKHPLQLPVCKTCGQRKVVHIRTGLCSSCGAAAQRAAGPERTWLSYTPGVPASVIRELAGHGVTEADLREYKRNPVADADKAVADYVPEGQAELSANLLRYMKNQVIELVQENRSAYAHWEMNREWAAETRSVKPYEARNTRHLLGFPEQVSEKYGVPELVPDQAAVPTVASPATCRFFGAPRLAGAAAVDGILQEGDWSQSAVDEAAERLNQAIITMHALPPNQIGKEKP